MFRKPNKIKQSGPTINIFVARDPEEEDKESEGEEEPIDERYEEY